MFCQSVQGYWWEGERWECLNIRLTNFSDLFSQHLPDEALIRETLYMKWMYVLLNEVKWISSCWDWNSHAFKHSIGRWRNYWLSNYWKRLKEQLKGKIRHATYRLTYFGIFDQQRLRAQVPSLSSSFHIYLTFYIFGPVMVFWFSIEICVTLADIRRNHIVEFNVSFCFLFFI